MGGSERLQVLRKGERSNSIKRRRAVKLFMNNIHYFWQRTKTSTKDHQMGLYRKYNNSGVTIFWLELFETNNCRVKQSFEVFVEGQPGVL